MKFYKKILLLIILNSIAIFSFSANFSSAADGAWSSNSTWGGSSHPDHASSDNITINSGDSVYTSTDVTIKNGGYLIIKTGGILRVVNIEFSNGSHIVIETGGRLIVTGDLTNKNNSNDVAINGQVNVAGNFSNGTGGVVTGTGSVQVSGSYSGSGSTFGITNSNNSSNSTVSGSNLPIELLFIDYIINSYSISILWASSAEVNNDYYSIEKSTDGKNYEIIGNVAGAGNSNSVINYKFTDENPTEGYSFYRIKQTDFDGKFKYIGTIVCNYKSEKEISVLVNSTENGISVIHNEIKGNYTVEVYSINGQLIFSNTYSDANSGQIINISFSNSDKGMYILNINTQSGYSKSIKFIR